MAGQLHPKTIQVKQLASALLRRIYPCSVVEARINGPTIAVLLDGQLLVASTPWRASSTTRDIIEAWCLHRLILARNKNVDATGTIGVVRRVKAEHLDRLPDLLRACGVEREPVLLVGLDGSGWLQAAGHPPLHLLGDDQAARPSRHNLSWSARQQWVVRALCLGGLASRGWWPETPVLQRINAASLARTSGISLSMIAKDVGLFVKQGWIHASRLAITVQQPLEMAQALLDYHRVHPVVAVPVRPAGAAWTNPTDVDRFLAKWRLNQRGKPRATGPPWALTGWRALAARGLSVTTRSAERPWEIIGDIDALMETWRLIPTTRDQAHLILVTAHPADVANATTVVDGMPCVDPLLATAHVLHDPEGGQEQARHFLALVSNINR